MVSKKLISKKNNYIYQPLILFLAAQAVFLCYLTPLFNTLYEYYDVDVNNLVEIILLTLALLFFFTVGYFIASLFLSKYIVKGLSFQTRSHSLPLTIKGSWIIICFEICLALSNTLLFVATFGKYFLRGSIEMDFLMMNDESMLLFPGQLGLYYVSILFIYFCSFLFHNKRVRDAHFIVGLLMSFLLFKRALILVGIILYVSKSSRKAWILALILIIASYSLVGALRNNYFEFSIFLDLNITQYWSVSCLNYLKVANLVIENLSTFIGSSLDLKDIYYEQYAGTGYFGKILLSGSMFSSILESIASGAYLCILWSLANFSKYHIFLMKPLLYLYVIGSLAGDYLTHFVIFQFPYMAIWAFLYILVLSISRNAHTVSGQ